jgi:hypothetical protein
MSPFLLEGHQMYPFPTHLHVPGEALGSLWEAEASSPHSFLKVLLGTRRFGVIGAWRDNSGGRSNCGSSSFRRSAVVGISFSFLSHFISFRFDCAEAPSFLSCGCSISIAGRKHVSWMLV